MMSAKETLRRILTLDALIEDKKNEIERLASMAAGLRSADYSERVQAPPRRDRIGDAVGEIIALENELAGDISELMRLKREVKNKIDRLPAPYCDILYQRYFAGHTWQTIADNLNYSYQHICRLHGTALVIYESLPETK